MSGRAGEARDEGGEGRGEGRTRRAEEREGGSAGPCEGGPEGAVDSTECRTSGLEGIIEVGEGEVEGRGSGDECGEG